MKTNCALEEIAEVIRANERFVVMSHVRPDGDALGCTLAMARLEPGSARSDFFILTEDIPGFSAGATDPGFAAFGHVVDEMKVADKIFHDPRSATKGA